jgi:hypothetical protein
MQSGTEKNVDITMAQFLYVNNCSCVLFFTSVYTTVKKINLRFRLTARQTMQSSTEKNVDIMYANSYSCTLFFYVSLNHHILLKINLTFKLTVWPKMQSGTENSVGIKMA